MCLITQRDLEKNGCKHPIPTNPARTKWYPIFLMLWRCPFDKTSDFHWLLDWVWRLDIHSITANFYPTLILPKQRSWVISTCVTFTCRVYTRKKAMTTLRIPRGWEHKGWTTNGETPSIGSKPCTMGRIKFFLLSKTLNKNNKIVSSSIESNEQDAIKTETKHIFGGSSVVSCTARRKQAPWWPSSNTSAKHLEARVLWRSFIHREPRWRRACWDCSFSKPCEKTFR